MSLFKERRRYCRAHTRFRKKRPVVEMKDDRLGVIFFGYNDRSLPRLAQCAEPGSS